MQPSECRGPMAAGVAHRFRVIVHVALDGRHCGDKVCRANQSAVARRVSMMTSDQARLDRIRGVTANYFFWQGLRLVPGGLILVIGGLLWSDWWPFTGWVEDALLVGVLLAALSVSLAIGRYYQRVFGQVQVIPGHRARRDAIKWLVFYPAMFASLLIDALTRIPFLISGIIWGAAIVAFWWSTGRGRYHYLVAASVLVVLTFLPTLGMVARGTPMLSLFFIVLGGIYIVGGVLDHLELRRLLPPVTADTEAEIDL